MSDYTPDTAAVKSAYESARYEHSIANCISMDRAGREFDRWLAEHDRQVAERAWEEGARWAAVEFGKDASMDESQVGLVPSDNPYRKEQENTNA